MIKIILILLTIHYIGFILNKSKTNILSCGLFGWAGQNVKHFNKDKFDKLGIYNIERGKSSCGISFDGDIQIGIDSTKLYSDFIIDKEINPKRFPIVIGHTRQASTGNIVNVYNAHPFGFGDNNGDFIFIGAHNGTLKNHDELAKKYEIEKNVENSYFDKNDVEVITNRNKIDSEILLEIIYKHKNFKVLSEYIGGAALVFTDTTNPNVLYLFKGKSKDYMSSTHETTERPLFVYIENKHSMYFSSLEDSLKTIGGKNKNIIDIEANVVYKITNGDFLNAEKIVISRKNATQSSYTFNNYNSYNPYYHSQEYYNELDTAFEEKNKGKEKKEEKSSSIIILPASKNVNIQKEVKEEKINIYNEKTLKDVNEYKGIPYFNKLRWWRNGQLVTGIYTWINNYGYYFLGYTIKAATEKFYSDIVDNVFDGNVFRKETNIKGKIPFPSKNYSEPLFFYFVEGVRLKAKFI